jgi:hypothetical protein
MANYFECLFREWKENSFIGIVEARRSFRKGDERTGRRTFGFAEEARH